MDTIDYFSQRAARELKVTLSRDQILDAIADASEMVTGSYGDLIPMDATGAQFQFQYGPINDRSCIIYRSTDPELIVSPTLALTKESFNANYPPYPAFGAQCQIDYGYRAIRFEVPVNPSVDFIYYQYLAVSKEKFDEIILTQKGLTQSVYEEDRSNVRLKRYNLLDILAKKKKLDDMGSAGRFNEVIEINATRLSNGEIFGADEETGEAL